MKGFAGKFLTALSVSIFLSSASAIIIYGSISKILTKENIKKVMCSMDIQGLLTDNTNSYDELVNKYTNNTSLSEVDVNKVLNSKEYSEIVGNYMMSENMLDLASITGLEDIKELEGLGDITDSEEITKEINNITNNQDYLKNINSIDNDEIKKIFEQVGVNYTDSDVSYIEKSIVNNVAPDLQKSISSNNLSANNGVSGINLNILDVILSDKIINASKILLIISAIGIFALNIRWLNCLLVFGGCFGGLAIMSKLLYLAVNSINTLIPKEYVNVGNIFITPLKEDFKHSFTIMLICAIVCIVINIALRLTFTKTSIGDSLSFVHKIYKNQDGEIEIGDSATIRASDCKVTDFDNINFGSGTSIIDDFENDLHNFDDIK